ncbi:MAG: alpha/beta hydrolase family protein, partial [Thermoanaerobaculia bacterium]
MTARPSAAVVAALIFLLCPALGAPEESTQPPGLEERLDQLENNLRRLSFALSAVGKKVDDLLWFERVGDVAEIDKVYIPTVPNPHETPRYGIANERHPVRIYCYVFIPLKLDRDRRQPMIVLPHGGVHSNFNTYYTHIVRELMAQGYVVIAPEYRGSTGYGRSYWEAIDYGGLEVEDVVAARDWAVERYG